MQFTKQGKRLLALTKSRDKIIGLTLWDCASESKTISFVKRHDFTAYRVAMSPDCKRFVTIGDPEIPHGPVPITIRDVESGATLGSFIHAGKTPYHYAKSVDISPKGKTLIIHNEMRHSGGWHSYQNTLWDINQAIPQRVWAVAERPRYSPDGEWLAVPIPYGAELHRDDSSQKRTIGYEKLGDERSTRLSSHIAMEDHRCPELEFSPDSRRLVFHQYVYSAPPQSAMLRWISRHIYSADRDPFRVCRVVEVATGREVARFSYVERFLFAPNGMTLVTIHYDGTVRFWDVPFRKPVAKTIGIACLLWVLSLAGLLAARSVLRTVKVRVEKVPE
jgi:WD40 repeat protein